MKKFLVYLSVIVVSIALGFTIFQLVKDDETISLSATSVYKNVGDEFELDINYDHKKSYTKVEKILVNNASIAAVTDESECKFVAKSGGYTQIVVKTNNTKFRNLNCDVYVGEGTLINPFYIYNAEQLLSIGQVTGVDAEGNDIVKYSASANYKLMADIDLTTADEYGYWTPIAYNITEGFTGRIDGNGFTVYNLNLDMDKYNSVRAQVLGSNFVSTDIDNVGFISKLGVGGKVQNLRLSNVTIDGTFDFAGSVAGINNGTIERSQINDLTINSVNGNACIGGVVGSNAYVTAVPRIDRCSVSNGNFGRTKVVGEDGDITYSTTSVLVNGVYVNGLKGAWIGGLAGINGGGIVIYSYAKVEVQLYSKFGDDSATNGTLEKGYFGGLVGYNTYFKYEKDAGDMTKWKGGNIKDCYAFVNIYPSSETMYANAVIGKIAGFSGLSEEYSLNTGAGEKVKKVNRVFGDYYVSNTLGDYVAFGDSTSYPNSTIQFNADGTVNTSNANSYLYVAAGLTYADLAKANGLYSYIDSDNEAVAWKFNEVWYKSTDNTLPYLDYSVVTSVTDDLYTIADAGEINSLDKLKSIDMDGYYYISTNITLPEDWPGLGTEDEPFVGHLYGTYYLNSDNEKVYYTITASDTITKPLFNYIGEGGLVKEIHITGVTLNATTNPCGILCNENYGSIRDSVVADSVLDVNTARLSNRTTVIAGTFAGYNSGVITGCNTINVKVDVYYTAIEENDISTNTIAYVGGVAGQNVSGSVSNSNVFTKKMIGTQNSIASGLVGGIVGSTTGRITDCYVFAPLMSSMTDSDSYAGGIAGSVSGNLSASATNASDAEYSINGKKALAQVYNCGYTGGGISGYNAGGVIGILSMTNLGDRILDIASMDYSNDVSFTSDSRWPNDVEKVYAASSAGAIEGTYIGGIVSKISNGVIANSYADIQLTGKNVGDNEAVVGGLASILKWKDSDGVHFDGGILEKCYSNCSFKGEGTAYALAYGQIRTVSLKSFFTSGVSTGKTDGIAKNCVYNSDNGGSLPDGQNGVQNLFSSLQDTWNKWFNTSAKWAEFLVADLNKIKSTTSGMYGTSIYDNNGFDKIYTWVTSSSSMAKLNGLKYLVLNDDGSLIINADGTYKMA